MFSKLGVNADIEIRKLSAKAVFDLSQILDVEQSWKQLMANISDVESGKIKYSVEHINLIEKTADNQRRSPTEILLQEWGTSGSRRPHISDLLNILVKAELFRAADYVSVHLLNEQFPLRPSYGPAASVDIPDDLPAPSAPPLSVWGSECHKETIPLEQMKNEMMNSEIVPHFSYNTLLNGTDNFSENRKLGSGGFGSVYLCNLNFEKMAVKRLYDAESALFGLADKQFGIEIKLLGGISHQNILPIIGYCNDGPYKCLIYTFMSNGSLEDALKCETRCILNWQKRLQICCGTAEGINYLHMMEKPIIHRDLKSANILLDENLIPKVGDFGLVKAGKPLGKPITMHTSTVVGTSAYMAPEAFKGEISAKGDVFSFGVVLLEVITGLPPYDEERESYDLLTYVDDVDNIKTLVDRRLEDPDEDQIDGLYEIAKKCCHHNKKLRPTMADTIYFINGLTK